MPTAASFLEPHSARPDLRSVYPAALVREGHGARVARLEQAPGVGCIVHQPAATTETPTISNESAKAWSQRIRELIRIEGSAAAIAGRCGFSEGTVRNWRDGRSDISRERCITMARALGISLIWLMTGDGPMKDLPSTPGEQPCPAPAMPMVSNASRARGLDSELLATSLRLMQSYMSLIGGSLEPRTRAVRTAELYDILSHCGDTAHMGRLVNFHQTLRNQLRHDRTLIA